MSVPVCVGERCVLVRARSVVLCSPETESRTAGFLEIWCPFEEGAWAKDDWETHAGST